MMNEDIDTMVLGAIRRGVVTWSPIALTLKLPGRAVDRSLQRLRRAKRITYSDRKWSVVL
jgi:hypothetical protein